MCCAHQRANGFILAYGLDKKTNEYRVYDLGGGRLIFGLDVAKVFQVRSTNEQFLAGMTLTAHHGFFSKNSRKRTASICARPPGAPSRARQLKKPRRALDYAADRVNLLI